MYIDNPIISTRH